ncbi:MAG: response regulator [Clostridiales bacterium]
MYKILVADDEVVEIKAIKYIINKSMANMFEVFEASNGKELVEKAFHIKPDIIIVDIKMPGINGLEAIAMIKETLPKCRVVVMSAYNYFTFAKEALSLKVDEFLMKPVPADTMIKCFKKLIDLIEINRINEIKNEEMNLKLNNLTHYMEEELIMLFNSGEVKESLVEEFFNVLNVNYKSFMFLAIEICENNDDVNENFKKKVYSEIEKRLKKQCKYTLKNIVCNQFFILLVFDIDISKNSINDILFDTIEEIKKEFNTNLIIGISDYCNLISDISKSFFQAKISLKQNKKENITKYGECDNDKFANYPLINEKKLIKEFILCNKEEVLEIYDELVNWIVNNSDNLDKIKEIIYEILHSTIREAALELKYMDFYRDLQSYKENLFSLDTKTEIRTYSKMFLKEKIKEFIEHKKLNSISFSFLIKEFINKNYSSDITLENVSKVFKISPYYLSKIFKKEEKINFIDYLTEFRMKKACEFLKLSKNNVKEVCYLVGYNDPNYFTKVFKRICGETPSSYRKNNL